MDDSKKTLDQIIGELESRKSLELLAKHLEEQGLFRPEASLGSESLALSLREQFKIDNKDIEKVYDAVVSTSSALNKIRIKTLWWIGLLLLFSLALLAVWTYVSNTNSGIFKFPTKIDSGHLFILFIGAILIAGKNKGLQRIRRDLKKIDKYSHGLGVGQKRREKLESRYLSGYSDHDKLARKSGDVPYSEYEVVSEPPSPFQCHAVYPNPFSADAWQRMLVYVYAAAAWPEVAEDLGLRALTLKGSISEAKEAISHSIPKGTTLTVMPDIPGVQCNPPSYRFRWLEDWHLAEFRVKADTGIRTDAIRGVVRIYLESLLVAEIEVTAQKEAIPVMAFAAASPQPQQKETHATGKVYRKIFVSYAHKDTPVVEQLEKAYRALGDDYLRDVKKLRSGEVWSEALEQMIADADLFQLCWSDHAKGSRYVEQEWRSALKRSDKSFIRPVYWEKPMPALPAELQHLHVAFLGEA